MPKILYITISIPCRHSLLEESFPKEEIFLENLILLETFPGWLFPSTSVTPVFPVSTPSVLQWQSRTGTSNQKCGGCIEVQGGAGTSCQKQQPHANEAGRLLFKSGFVPLSALLRASPGCEMVTGTPCAIKGQLRILKSKKKFLCAGCRERRCCFT